MLHKANAETRVPIYILFSVFKILTNFVSSFLQTKNKNENQNDKKEGGKNITFFTYILLQFEYISVGHIVSGCMIMI